MSDPLSRARAVLKRAPVFDGHNDLAWVIRRNSRARGDVIAYDLTRPHQESDTDIPRLIEGQVGAQFWAAFQPTGVPNPARTTLELIDTILRIEQAHPDVFVPGRRASDYVRARRAGENRVVHSRRGRRGIGEFAGAAAHLACGGGAHAHSLPQRNT